jgi:hypothetical protein
MIKEIKNEEVWSSSSSENSADEEAINFINTTIIDKKDKITNKYESCIKNYDNKH